MYIIRTQHMFHFKIIQTFDQSTQVVFIIMRRDHIINGLYLLIFQILYHFIRMCPISTIIKKIFSSRLYKDRQSLAHINKMNSHIALPVCLRSNSISR